jgi:hypothetical protein
VIPPRLLLRFGRSARPLQVLCQTVTVGLLWLAHAFVVHPGFGRSLRTPAHPLPQPAGQTLHHERGQLHDDQKPHCDDTESHRYWLPVCCHWYEEVVQPELNVGVEEKTNQVDPEKHHEQRTEPPMQIGEPRWPLIVEQSGW